MNKKYLIIILLIVVVNIIGSWVFYRWDLTEENRYSLSDATKQLMEGLDDELYIEVYLDGEDLPGGFERLKKATQETLEELEYTANTPIEFAFIDPTASKTDPALVDTLLARGVQPTNVFDSKGGKRTEDLIFPYATIFYKGKESTILLLKANQSLSAEEKLNQSTENLEYGFAKAIKQISTTKRKKIGLLTEFTLLEPTNFSGLINSLQTYYDLYILDAKASQTFQGLDALILPKPDLPVDDSTKLKIDQFVHSGGSTLFFIDGLTVDSIGLQGTYAQPLSLNIEDLLFKYGVRLNKDLVKDGLNSLMVPIVVGQMGDKPNIQPIPYRFFPLINNFGESVITKNVDMVATKFASTLDTVVTPGIRKTALLLTSDYSKVLGAPALVTYNDSRKETDEATYNEGPQVVSYLLEGRFQSLYKNRLLSNDGRSAFYEGESMPAKVLICSDGDIIINDVNRQTGEPQPLGFDRASQRTFGNEDFVMNAVSYMVEENGLINARSKEIKLRPLDEVKVRTTRTRVQVLALLIPTLLIALFGLIRAFWVKKKYTS